MLNSATALLDKLHQELAGVASAKQLADLKVAYLGKNGALNALRKGVDFKTLSDAEKKSIGEVFNTAKTSIEDAFAAAQEKLDASGPAFEPVNFDPTLPGTDQRNGAIHPIISTQLEVEHIFQSMGFQVYTGDEAVSEFENFDALNIPGDHPARDMQDTFWLENGMVLRTHTSSMQNRAMRDLGVPLRAIFPGRCFRNEAIDATHENTFYQLEGMMIDKHITVSHLIAVMKELLDKVFQRDNKVRLRPGFFPFVEPGFELDMWIDLGKGGRWLELMPCGMIHPAVLRNGGVDPNEYSGFAFGLGLTRLAMIKHGIPDIRLFNGGDLRFYEQFAATL
ncbi:MAG: phenylalanine--tRNA ligase subunit alpha [Planctomycetaceae bacterium]